MKNSSYWKHVIISIIVCLILYPVMHFTGISISKGPFRIESITFFIGIMLVVISHAPSIVLGTFLSSSNVPAVTTAESKFGSFIPLFIAIDIIGWAVIGYMIGSFIFFLRRRN